MASSNRHWPSMFKSKPCNTHHHQWQHDANSSSLITNGSHKATYTSGCEERSPEPKPRWNPKQEQIRILEAIFNSGMVNPPRDEIRKIRAQLQEFGQVGDANVFYWFQNRKSRSKHKQRQLQNKSQTTTQQNPPPNTTTIATIATISTATITPPSSSSSSSGKSSSPNSADKSFSIGSKNMMDLSNNSPTASVNNNGFLQTHHNEFFPEHFFFPMHQTPPEATTTSFTQGFSFPDIINVSQVADQAVAPCPSLFLSDLQAFENHEASKKVEDDQKMKLQEQLSYTYPPTNITIPSTVHHGQGGGESGGGLSSSCATKSTVFINDVAFEVTNGNFNVREAFGDDAALIHSSGQPVVTNEWGITLHPLHSGAFYYLFRTSSTPSHDNTIDLM